MHIQTNIYRLYMYIEVLLIILTYPMGNSTRQKRVKPALQRVIARDLVLSAIIHRLFS